MNWFLCRMRNPILNTFLSMWLSSSWHHSLKTVFLPVYVFDSIIKNGWLSTFFRFYLGVFSCVSQNHCSGCLPWVSFHCKALHCVAHFLGRCEWRSTHPTQETNSMLKYWYHHTPVCWARVYWGYLRECGQGLLTLVYESCGTKSVSELSGRLWKLEPWRSLHDLRTLS